MSNDENNQERSTRELFTPEYLRLIAVQMLFGVSYSASLLLPKYLRQEFQATAESIGWIMGSALVAGVLVAPFLGVITRNFSARMILSGAILLEATALLLLCQVEQIGPLIYFARVLQGVAWITIYKTTYLLAAAAVPVTRLSQAIGYMGLSMLVTNALAPAFAEPVAQLYGWNAVFYTAAFAAFISLIVASRLTVAPKKIETEKLESAIPYRKFFTVSYVSFAVGMGIGVMFTFTQPFALALGAENVGQFFFGYVPAAAFVRIVFGRLPDRIGTRKSSLASLLLYSAVVISTSMLKVSLLVPLGVGLGLAHGMLYPSLMAYLLNGLNKEQRSTGIDWLLAAFNGGYAISLLALGRVADQMGYPMVFLLVGTMLLIGFPVLLSSERKTILRRKLALRSN